MTKRKVWRYKCDFCGKSNCSAFAIRNHEKHCCHNPHRMCRMCKSVGDEGFSYFEYSSVLMQTGINGLKCFLSCPNCILTTIFLLPKAAQQMMFQGFDYKEARLVWWEAFNDQERAREDW